MNYRSGSRGTLLVGVVLSASLAGCGLLGRAPAPGDPAFADASREREQAPYWVARDEAQEILWQNPDRGWVGLVATEAQRRHDHPVRVDDEWLRQTLYDLRLWIDGKDDDAQRIRLIDNEVLDAIAPALAHGLARAESGQAVGFVVASRLPGFNFINPMRLTTGRVFVKDDRLHILFGHVADQLQMGEERPAAIRRASVGTRERVLNRGDRIWSRGWGTEVVREDWITAPVRTSQAALPQLPPSREPAPAAERRPAPAAAEPARQDATTTESDKQDEAAPATLRERLELLQSLHDDGLITDEEYERTRRDLLEQL